MDFKKVMDEKYKEILEGYMLDPSEIALYSSQKFSRKAIEHKISPEDVVSLHRSLLSELHPDLPESVHRSFDILLEVMIGYGFAYREHQTLRSIQQELNNEIDIAVNMQNTLLQTHIPNLKPLDVGAISVAAKKMSGDYYHFVQNKDHSMSVAIADIIGKGIPAALCMSMIKYAMDSLPDDYHAPNSVLENLNRVVEQNVDASMFITMFYGMYQVHNHTFYYSTAGHEPGFFYRQSDQSFHTIEGKGLLLGVDKQTKYQQYEHTLQVGDMIILMSDGVTECRTEEGFIERDTLLEMIQQHLHLPSQELVQTIYKELERAQDFQLRDDFTLIVIKRKIKIRGLTRLFKGY
ncbi:phosphoserine phosphatase [Bacillus coahuilensis p1.1.43]|uniref:Phosphoserine phosphatase n=1 Tax=Bacillus coahuilensis p1.1.43 TaxID=1150625 RepID=A0A147K5Q6_9BACI|nr:PP2C family protein-serine/threonine phosphatase [Bacillus coahuilensis]KUP05034.1 phosphoserine phosphatase [Bacillus coahuilensis p1.1.43]